MFNTNKDTAYKSLACAIHATDRRLDSSPGIEYWRGHGKRRGRQRRWLLDRRGYCCVTRRIRGGRPFPPFSLFWWARSELSYMTVVVLVGPALRWVQHGVYVFIKLITKWTFASGTLFHNAGQKIWLTGTLQHPARGSDVIDVVSHNTWECGACKLNHS